MYLYICDASKKVLGHCASSDLNIIFFNEILTLKYLKLVLFNKDQKKFYIKRSINDDIKNIYLKNRNATLSFKANTE